jgi:acyl-CoA reductase-like NAD-dependent aldehyde dehydrogenase
MASRTDAHERALLIDGEWITTGEWIDVTSPYSGKTVGRVARGGRAEAERAVDAAARALESPLAAHERAEILSTVAALVDLHREEIAHTICNEAGKPLKTARAEAARAMSTYTFAAVEARKLAGEMVPMDASPAGAGKLGFTLRRPIGVVGAISPFNFPCNLVAHKLAPALAAGCPVVLKPATATPLSALLLGQLSQEAGLPAGWLNIVAGPAAEIGDVFVEDDRVRLITFTGSGEVGWRLQERAPRKRVKLELGNSTPVIVADDADVESAAAKLAANAFAFAGQSCISVQRIYVQTAQFDRFIASFLPQVEALTVGDPCDESTDVGPVIDEESHDRIVDWIAESGGQLLAGGEEEGLIKPTVLAHVRDDAKVSCEEAFGPVVVVNPFDTLDEAIERANGTRFGLQAAIFTRSIDNALAAAERLEFGAVVVNEAPTFRSDQMPYGGVKASGNTKEGPAWAVREMTEERLVVIQR